MNAPQSTGWSLAAALSRQYWTPQELSFFRPDRLIAHGHGLCCFRTCPEEPERACMLGGNCPGNCPAPGPGPGPGASGPWLRELGCRRSLGPCAYLQVSPYWQEPVFMNLLQKRVLKNWRAIAGSPCWPCLPSLPPPRSAWPCPAGGAPPAAPHPHSDHCSQNVLAK